MNRTEYDEYLRAEILNAISKHKTDRYYTLREAAENETEFSDKRRLQFEWFLNKPLTVLNRTVFFEEEIYYPVPRKRHKIKLSKTTKSK